MMAASSDIPWLLCTVIAHASRRGTCVIFARILLQSCIAHSATSAEIVAPVRVFTMGIPSEEKQTTVPSVPFTYLASKLLRVNMTDAPSFSSSVSGERHCALSDSTSDCLQREVIWKT